MDWLRRIFSGLPGDSSRVEYLGVAVMVLGLAAIIVCGIKIKDKHSRGYLISRLAGLLVVAAGAVITMRIF